MSLSYLMLFVSTCFFLCSCSSSAQPNSSQADTLTVSPMSTQTAAPMQQKPSTLTAQQQKIADFYQQPSKYIKTKQIIAKMTDRSLNLALICPSIEATACISQPLLASELNKSSEFLFSQFFLSLFSNVDSTQYFVNSNKARLKSNYSINGKNFKQVTSSYVIKRGIADFIEILQVERLGNSYIYTWVYGASSAMGKTLVDLSQAQPSLRHISNFRSNQAAANYMKTVFAGSQCIDNSSLLAYVSQGSTQSCP